MRGSSIIALAILVSMILVPISSMQARAAPDIGQALGFDRDNAEKVLLFQ